MWYVSDSFIMKYINATRKEIQVEQRTPRLIEDSPKTDAIKLVNTHTCSTHMYYERTKIGLKKKYLWNTPFDSVS